jgi:hypothetical protein
MQQRTPAAATDYDGDFARWAEAQAAALREGRFADLDLAKLTEEIEDLSNRKQDEIRSRLKQIAAHILKFQYQPERATPSWRETIVEQADAIEDVFDDSPSLRRELPAFIAKAYPRACRLASRETTLPITTFPATPTPQFERALHAVLAGEDFEP